MGKWKYYHKEHIHPRIPSVVQRDWWHLGSPGTQVQSLAWYSGLRILCCHSCSCGLDLIAGLGTPCAKGAKKEKKKTNQKTHTHLYMHSSISILSCLVYELVFLSLSECICVCVYIHICTHIFS